MLTSPLRNSFDGNGNFGRLIWVMSVEVDIVGSKLKSIFFGFISDEICGTSTVELVIDSLNIVWVVVRIAGCAVCLIDWSGQVGHISRPL